MGGESERNPTARIGRAMVTAGLAGLVVGVVLYAWGRARQRSAILKARTAILSGLGAAADTRGPAAGRRQSVDRFGTVFASEEPTRSYTPYTGTIPNGPWGVKPWAEAVDLAPPVCAGKTCQGEYQYLPHSVLQATADATPLTYL